MNYKLVNLTKYDDGVIALSAKISHSPLWDNIILLCKGRYINGEVEMLFSNAVYDTPEYNFLENVERTLLNDICKTMFLKLTEGIYYESIYDK